MKAITVLGCVFCTALCLADTLTTLDGKKYEDYEISRLRHNGISIIHSKGAATIPWDKLPVDMQKKYADKIPELKKKEAARLERVKKYKQYQQAAGKLKSLTLEFWANDDNSDSAYRMKCVKIINKTSILAKPCEYVDYIIIIDIDTKYLTDDSYIPGNIKFEKKAKKNDKIRLYYVGAGYSEYGKVHKFTKNKQKAVEYILKNPNAKAPQMTKKPSRSYSTGSF